MLVTVLVGCVIMLLCCVVHGCRRFDYFINGPFFTEEAQDALQAERKMRVRLFFVPRSPMDTAIILAFFVGMVAFMGGIVGGIIGSYISSLLAGEGSFLLFCLELLVSIAVLIQCVSNMSTFAMCVGAEACWYCLSNVICQKERENLLRNLRLVYDYVPVVERTAVGRKSNYWSRAYARASARLYAPEEYLKAVTARARDLAANRLKVMKLEETLEAAELEFSSVMEELFERMPRIWSTLHWEPLDMELLEQSDELMRQIDKQLPQAILQERQGADQLLRELEVLVNHLAIIDCRFQTEFLQEVCAELYAVKLMYPDFAPEGVGINLEMVVM